MKIAILAFLFGGHLGRPVVIPTHPTANTQPVVCQHGTCK